MNSNLPISLKRKVYNQCILPVLTYGSGTWHLTKEETQKLRSAQRGIERKMLGSTWRDRFRTTWIRQQTRVEDILMTIEKEEMVLFGPYYVQNRQQIDKEGNGMGTKRLQGKQATAGKKSGGETQ